MIEALDRSRRILTECRVVAVLGAHPARWRPAFYVPEYLHSMGYRVVPVNPGKVGESLWGEPVRDRLSNIDVPVDLVDVFRRSEALPEHLEDILAMDPLPHVVWFQQGIYNQNVARQLEEAGIEVVQDRCTLADHRTLSLGRVEP